MTRYFLKRGTDNTIVCSSNDASVSAMLLNDGFVMIGKRDAAIILRMDASCVFHQAYFDSRKKVIFERMFENEKNL